MIVTGNRPLWVQKVSKIGFSNRKHRLKYLKTRDENISILKTCITIEEGNLSCGR